MRLNVLICCWLVGDVRDLQLNSASQAYTEHDVPKEFNGSLFKPLW